MYISNDESRDDRTNWTRFFPSCLPLPKMSQLPSVTGTEFEYAELENVLHFSGCRLMTALLILLLVFTLIFQPRGVRSFEYTDTKSLTDIKISMNRHDTYDTCVNSLPFSIPRSVYAWAKLMQPVLATHVVSVIETNKSIKALMTGWC